VLDATQAAKRAKRRFSLRRLLSRGEEGQSLVELGLVLPIFLVIVIGVVEVADSLNAYITLVDAARDGARLGSKDLTTDNEIKNLVVVETGRLRDPVNPNSDVSIEHTQVDGVDAIRVQVCNDRSLILNIPLVMSDSFRMCSETTMRVLSQQS
jgi:Flp pilus assembly protein TadG